MLQHLFVKNLALIDQVEVDFGEGLNILSGETGAGKSIILGSIHLALGGKYTKEMLRNGASSGLVELVFSLKEERQSAQLKAIGIAVEDGQVVLSRKFTEGRSISKINGETVTKSTLQNVASILIDIHGQQEHQTLLHKKNHLAILDAFAKEQIESVKKEVSNTYHIYQKKKKEIEELKSDGETRKRELSFLEFEVKEIAEAELKLGEDELMEEQYKRMTNGKQITQNASEAYRCCGEEGGSVHLSRALQLLQQVGKYDDEIENLYKQLVEIDNLLNDFNRELLEYSNSFSYDMEEFEAVEARLNTINHMKTKYGSTIEEIKNYEEEKVERLSRLLDYEGNLKRAEEELIIAKEQYEKSALVLSKLRKEASVPLVLEIKKGLLDLNFQEVQFELELSKLDEGTGNGFEQGQFLISMNQGEPVKPLSQVASGGELSRIMLAIKTVLANKDEIETLIFDEIDTGISGRTAGKVAEKLNVLGKNHQVICITHLAQIAAMADKHFAIEKKSTQGITKTFIMHLDEEESVKELARILGGEYITDSIYQSAKEMKKTTQAI